MARSVLAVLLGYALMGLLITIVQETWLGGVSFRGSPLTVLLVAGVLTFLAAVVAGYVAGWIAGRYPGLHAIAMSVLVAAETTYLIKTGRTTDPIWFDVTAAGSLVVGVLLGACLTSLSWRGPRGTGQISASA